MGTRLGATLDDGEDDGIELGCVESVGDILDDGLVEGDSEGTSDGDGLGAGDSVGSSDGVVSTIVLLDRELTFSRLLIVVDFRRRRSMKTRNIRRNINENQVNNINNGISTLYLSV